MISPASAELPPRDGDGFAANQDLRVAVGVFRTEALQRGPMDFDNMERPWFQRNECPRKRILTVVALLVP
jgi:hypothetical protein